MNEEEPRTCECHLKSRKKITVLLYGRRLVHVKVKTLRHVIKVATTL